MTPSIEGMHARTVTSRWARAWLWAAVGGLTACVAEPPRSTCGERGDDDLGVAVAASSDDFEPCAPCEPRCFRALDSIRSADVAVRGRGGLRFDPALAGATAPRHRVPCEDFPCVAEWEYEDGASYERVYGAYDPGRCDPLNEAPLWSDFEWAATIPAGTSITLEIQMTNILPATSERPTRTIEISGASESPLFLAAALVEMGLSSAEVYAPYAIIRVVLHPSADRLRAPTLRGLSLEMYCQGGGV